MKKILILLFLIVFGVLLYQESLLLKLSNYGVIDLEISEQDKGASIISIWQKTLYGDQTLLTLARQNTHLDFLFIIVYVALMVTLSNSRMQREKSSWLNELLRLNLLLAFLIGALDLVENIRILHNFHHVGNTAEFWSTCYFSLPKFALLFWVVLVYVLSLVKSLFINDKVPNNS